VLHTLQCHRKRGSNRSRLKCGERGKLLNRMFNLINYYLTFSLKEFYHCLLECSRNIGIASLSLNVQFII
jgi:hypothetical protein